MTTPENAAIDALVRSRERMRTALREALDSGGNGGNGGNGAATPSATESRISAGLSAWSWLAPLRSQPGVGPLIDRALLWWAPHPLRQAAGVLGTAAKAAVQPVAQKHPLALVLGAAAVGALLVVSRPWRLLITPALLASLAPRLLVNVIGQMPRGSWLGLLSALMPSSRAQAPAKTAPQQRTVPGLDRHQGRPQGAVRP